MKKRTQVNFSLVEYQMFYNFLREKHTYFDNISDFLEKQYIPNVYEISLSTSNFIQFRWKMAKEMVRKSDF